MFCESLAEDISNGGDNTGFWRKIQHGIHSERVQPPKRIGEATSEEAILSLWRDHFSKGVNSQSLDSMEYDQLVYDEKHVLRMKIGRMPWWCVEILLCEVLKACNNLKVGKSSGNDNIEAEHLKFGGSALVIHLSVVFTCLLRHPFIPDQFKKSYLVPIIKDTMGNAADPDNFREIAISSTVSKVLKLILLNKLANVLGYGEQQFGFKRGHSCSDCSFVLKKTVDFYLAKGNDAVYASSLNLSKALTRCHSISLFVSFLIWMSLCTL